ncbi:hypothetical protein [Rhodohalobacter mucosus]|uniref:Uncharacterized protein n=1 Tax=Rhodohalobacter mucosus TaxID=2079485 RepID=A0A316U0B8_9BACT|nr:hypothetical protein [Rhodohalobacter mucosus]PWN06106.1 hypothetical protein DDZ15_09640 [Rhodohalobacter mucosus]
MSKISGKKFGEPFKMRVVSGMLLDGSIQVSWATGEKASSQMDWGISPDDLLTTPEYNSEPQDMVRYHRLWFPTTYLDTRHYFRVRSRTISDRVGESPIYMVIVPPGVTMQVGGKLTAEIELEIIPLSDVEFISQSLPTTLPTTNTEPISSDSPATIEPVIDATKTLDHESSQSSSGNNLKTSFSITIT